LENPVPEYEENLKVSPMAGWLVLIVFTFVILGWGMLLMMAIMDTPREWDFGAYPDIPSQSVYSTSEPIKKAKVPLQISPLPEAQGQNNLGQPDWIFGRKKGR
jgi:hypothetical protein